MNDNEFPHLKPGLPGTGMARFGSSCESLPLPESGVDLELTAATRQNLALALSLSRGAAFRSIASMNFDNANDALTRVISLPESEIPDDSHFCVAVVKEELKDRVRKLREED